MRFISSHLTICIVIVTIGQQGCVVSTGISGRQFKKAALESPLIRLSDRFYPGDTMTWDDGKWKSQTLSKELRLIEMASSACRSRMYSKGPYGVCWSKNKRRSQGLFAQS